MSDFPPVQRTDGASAKSQGSMLLAFLAEQDVPCPSCGYNLRALRTTMCPECGQELHLRVNLVEPRMRLWIAGLVGLAGGAGFSTLLVIYAFLAYYIRGGGGVPASFYGITISGAVIEGLLLTLWALKGRAIRKLGLGVRSWLVAGCYVLSLANLVIFAINVR